MVDQVDTANLEEVAAPVKGKLTFSFLSPSEDPVLSFLLRKSRIDKEKFFLGFRKRDLFHIIFFENMSLFLLAKEVAKEAKTRKLAK